MNNKKKKLLIWLGVGLGSALLLGLIINFGIKSVMTPTLTPEQIEKRKIEAEEKRMKEEELKKDALKSVEFYLGSEADRETTNAVTKTAKGKVAYDNLKEVRSTNATVEKINEAVAKYKEIYDTEKEKIAKEKEEKENELKKQAEARQNILKQMEEEFKKSGMNIPQTAIGLKVTPIKKSYIQKDKNGKNELGKLFNIITVKVENVSDKEITLNPTRFIGIETVGFGVHFTPLTDGYVFEKPHFKDTLVLKPKDVKELDLVYLSLNHESYKGYGIRELIVTGNEVSNKYNEEFLPAMKFKLE